MFCRVILYIFAMALTSVPALADNKPSVEPMFEEFDSFSNRVWYVSDGWTNGPHQNCIWTKKGISTADAGQVTLNYFAVNGTYLCSEIQTRAFFLYGTFEARMRVEPGSGRNGAFFAYAGKVHGQPHQEIDFEVLTKSSNEVWLNRHLNGTDFGEGASVRSSDPTEDYLDYAFVWEPTKLRWYIDGKLVREDSEGIPYLPLKVYFSHWAGETSPNWLGTFEAPEDTVGLSLDRFVYTPLGAPCQFADSIACLVQ